MDTCPHGFPRPPEATFLGVKMHGSPHIEDARVRIISDARDCPDCLHVQLAAAHVLLLRAFTSPKRVDEATLALWLNYVERYHP